MAEWVVYIFQVDYVHKLLLEWVNQFIQLYDLCYQLISYEWNLGRNLSICYHFTIQSMQNVNILIRRDELVRRVKPDVRLAREDACSVRLFFYSIYFMWIHSNPQQSCETKFATNQCPNHCCYTDVLWRYFVPLVALSIHPWGCALSPPPQQPCECGNDNCNLPLYYVSVKHQYKALARWISGLNKLTITDLTFSASPGIITATMTGTDISLTKSSYGMVFFVI